MSLAVPVSPAAVDDLISGAARAARSRRSGLDLAAHEEFVEAWISDRLASAFRACQGETATERARLTADQAIRDRTPTTLLTIKLDPVTAAALEQLRRHAAARANVPPASVWFKRAWTGAFLEAAWRWNGS